MYKYIYGQVKLNIWRLDDCNVFQIVVVDEIIEGNQGLIFETYGKKFEISFTLSQTKCVYKIYFNKNVGACMSI